MLAQVKLNSKAYKVCLIIGSRHFGNVRYCFWASQFTVSFKSIFSPFGRSGNAGVTWIPVRILLVQVWYFSNPVVDHYAAAYFEDPELPGHSGPDDLWPRRQQLRCFRVGEQIGIFMKPEILKYPIQYFQVFLKYLTSDMSTQSGLNFENKSESVRGRFGPIWNSNLLKKTIFSVIFFLYSNDKKENCQQIFQDWFKMTS